MTTEQSNVKSSSDGGGYGDGALPPRLREIDSYEPAHMQIVDALSDEIAAGAYRAGS